MATTASTRLASMARRFAQLLAEGEFRPALRSAARLVWSTAEDYGLRRDLSVPFRPEPARLPLRVRPLQNADLDLLFDASAGDSPVQLQRQRRLLDSGIPTCWVAVDPDNRPCFMTWLIQPEQNAAMRAEMGPTFRPLAPDEVFLESGFTPRRYRGLRVGPEAVTRILEEAPPRARWAWAYTAVDNLAAQKSLTRSGFVPEVVLRSRWRLFRHSTDLEPVRALPSPP